MLHLSAGTAEDWGFGLPGERSLWRQDSTTLELAGVTTEGFDQATSEARESFDRVAGIKWANAA
jgi:hypothetical protein